MLGKRASRALRAALPGALAVVLVLAHAGAMAADAAPMRADLRATILMRAMAYERKLTSRQGDLRLVVLAGRSAASQQDAAIMHAAFSELANRLKIAGRHLVIADTWMPGDADALGKLRNDHAEIIYAATDSGPEIQHLAAALNSETSVFMCSDVNEVGHGCLIAVEQNEGKPRIVIHLGLARQLALNFDSRLLQLTRVIE